MEIPVGKCFSCGKAVQKWRCGDTTGGGTYHIVCLECNEGYSSQSGQSSILWRWVAGIVATGLMIGTLFIILVFGGP